MLKLQLLNLNTIQNYKPQKDTLYNTIDTHNFFLLLIIYIKFKRKCNI